MLKKKAGLKSRIKKAGTTAQYQNKTCGALWGAVGRLQPFLAMGRYIARGKNGAILGAFAAI